MEDSQIVQLYWERDARAIPASAEAYGTYCHAIAFRILFSEQDAEEAVNDTWLHAWNAIPPHRPSVLSTFLGKLTRRISLTMLQRRQAQKRGGGEFDLVLEELSECVSGGVDVEETVELRELSRAVAAFVRALPEPERRVFTARYYALASMEEIAVRSGFSQSKVKSMLHRTRLRLRAELEKEGYC